MRETLCAIFGSIGSVVVYYMGGVDEVLIVLGVFMLVDYFSGVIVALVFKNSPKSESGKVNSGASLKGLFKKLYMMVLVGIAHLLDVVLGIDFIRSGLIIAFITNETISIIENAGLMGIPIPNVLRDAIDILNDMEVKHE